MERSGGQRLRSGHGAERVRENAEAVKIAAAAERRR
jgi:hypothetical protein